MTFPEKLGAFSLEVAKIAKNLGLQFVNGPGLVPVAAPTAQIGHTNGQERGVYLLALAETSNRSGQHPLAHPRTKARR